MVLFAVLCGLRYFLHKLTDLCTFIKKKKKKRPNTNIVRSLVKQGSCKYQLLKLMV